MTWMMSTSMAAKTPLDEKLERAKEAINGGLPFSEVADKFELTRAVVWQLAMDGTINPCRKCAASGMHEGKLCASCIGSGWLSPGC